jgi:hypothetical protein
MRPLTIRGTALTLVVFADVTFLLCVGWGAVLSGLHARGRVVFEVLMPGFVWLTPASVLIGLAWASIAALYTAVVFVPLFNYFEMRRGA